MEVVILCGGRGTRLLPKTEKIPKPLISIGDKPILWYIMKTYSYYGYNDFILCLGYLGNKIKDYFQIQENREKGWKIKFINTGIDTPKAERLKMVKDIIEDNTFMVSYGDDISDININKLVDFHKKMGKIATLTAINPISQYGVLELNENDEIIGFKEKPKLDHWVNGGYFVFEKSIFEFMKKGWELEDQVFENLIKKRQLVAFKHKGFWKSMNTIKDVIELNELYRKSDLKKILWGD